MRRQWRMEQHPTQEEKMNHQHASDRTHAAFRRPACPERCRGELVEGAAPPSPAGPELYRRDFWILTSGFSPKYAKRPSRRSKAKTGTQFHPRRTRGRPKNKKRTQFAVQRPKNAERTQFTTPRPKNAKRTQFPPCEFTKTNPSHHPTIYYLLYAAFNKTNPIPPKQP